MIKAKVTKMPRHFSIPKENELYIIGTSSSKVRDNVERRLRIGQGAKGPLPNTKDNAPLRRTGRLASNITYHMRPNKKGVLTGVITASGPRPRDEFKSKDFNASLKQRAAREQASVTGIWNGKTLRLRKVRSKHSPSGFAMKFSTGKIKFRAAKTNHNVAAILSLPPSPNDKRGYNGKRKAYVVFDENTKDIKDFVEIVERYLKPEMK